MMVHSGWPPAAPTVAPGLYYMSLLFFFFQFNLATSKVLMMRKQVFGKEHPDWLRVIMMGNLALMYCQWSQGWFKEAEDHGGCKLV